MSDKKIWQKIENYFEERLSGPDSNIFPEKDIILIITKKIIPVLKAERYELAMNAFDGSMRLLESLQSLKVKGGKFAKVVFVNLDSLPELLGGIKEDSGTISAEKNLQEIKARQIKAK